MAKHLVLPVLAALLLGAPTSVQSQATPCIERGACNPCGQDRVRCAVRFTLPAPAPVKASLVVEGDGRYVGMSQSVLSECGRSAAFTGAVPVMNRNERANTHITILQGRATNCFEVSILACQKERGRAVPCERGFLQSRVEVEITPSSG